MFSGSGAVSRSSSNWSSTVSGIGCSSLVSAVCRPCLVLRLQVAIDEVDLLQPAQALADLLGPDPPHTLHGFELGIRGGEHLVEPAERLHDVGHDELRQARDAPQDAEAPW